MDEDQIYAMVSRMDDTERAYFFQTVEGKRIQTKWNEER